MTKQAINTRTQEEYDALMRYLDSNKYKWNSGHAPLEKNYWKNIGEDCCVRVDQENELIGYGHKSYYETVGYTIIPYTEFAKANIEPDWKALYLEGNKILREVSVRCNLIFPETEEEVKWFEEKTQKSGDLLIRLLEYLTKHNVTPNRDGE